MLELTITNETELPINLPGIIGYLGANREVKMASSRWDELKSHPTIEKFLANKEISVETGHLVSLNGLTLAEVEKAINACSDPEALRRWHVESKPDRTDFGKYTRWAICQRAAYTGKIKWQEGDLSDLNDETYWHPRDMAKTPDNSHLEARSQMWERQQKLEEIEKKTKEYKQNLLKELN